MIGEDTRELINKLLLERLSLAGISRVTGSAQWLQIYVNNKYSSMPQQVEVRPKKGEARAVQCDVTCSLS